MRRAGCKWRKSYKHKPHKKPKIDADVLKRRKNNASVQRAKEMQEYHRKHLLCAKSQQQQQRKVDPDEELVDDVMMEGEDELNPYDELVSELAKNATPTRTGAVSSSDEDDEDENGDDEDENGDDEDENGDDEDDDIEEEEDEDDGSDDEDIFEEFDMEEDDEELDIEEDDEEELGVEELTIEEDDDDDSDDENMDEGDVAEKGLDNGVDDKQANKAVKDEAPNDAKSNNENDKNGNGEVADDLEDDKSQSNDNFAMHLNYELPADDVEKLLAPIASSIKKNALHWPCLGDFSLEIPPITLPKDHRKTQKSLFKAPAAFETADALQELLGVKATLANNTQLPLTQLQSEMLMLLNNYHDIFYPQHTADQTNELRVVYCLHALNHMLKTRTRILHHNAKLTAAAAAAAEAESKRKRKCVKPNKADLIVPDSYCDQGLVRPKILIMLPFRESAYHVVSTFKQLLYSGNDTKKSNATVLNYERFVGEYTGQTLHLSKTNPKPEDYERIFEGNTDDNFRIGMSLTKKCLKLYTDFYASDIIIASPLGLRMIVGAEGSKERDYDFLNSIELLIIDQTELLFAQNWENVLHVLDHLHLQPKSLRDTDFQRVRPWCLSGLSRFYRQTLVLSSHELPEFRALFNNKCCNYAGRVRVCNRISLGSVRNVAVAIPQVFQRIEVTDLTSAFDERFRYFTEELLPRFRNPAFAHCMIYVPSYFDYVRLRNYLKAETISYVQICEYTNRAKMARARDMFYHSGVHFMLYSERSHFYRRTRIKGIRHMIMYQPPYWPNFYAEMLNLMHMGNQNVNDGLDEDAMSVTVLYTKYDMWQLQAILGNDAAAKLVRSQKSMHTITASE